MSSELGKCQVRVMQKPKQLNKMVNNTLVTLRVEFVPVTLSVQESVCTRKFRRYIKLWNPEVEGAEQKMFDNLVTRNKIFFEHQKQLMINCFHCTSVVCPKHPTQLGFEGQHDSFHASVRCKMRITLNVHGRM